VTTAELLLAAINSLQAVALAWIASRQHQVKRELKRTNGVIMKALDDSYRNRLDP
jgi:hypothetical protein